jgi:hypothetical protein
LFNLHYRGWTENPIKAEREPNEFDEFGPEHLMDINYITTIFKGKLELSIYLKNILDNKAKYPAPNNGGYTVNIGSNYGISFKLRP